MIYAPHTLQKRVVSEEAIDEFGRPINNFSMDEWADLCRCRCDDNGDRKVTLDDGTVIVPSYHIVVGTQTPGAKTGDFIRCVADDGTVRGQGEIIKTKTLNYLPYGELYV